MRSGAFSGRFVPMFDIDDTIDAFRRGTLDFDCKRMVLIQRRKDGDRFEGQGYIRQSPDGMPVCKLYVTQHNAEPYRHFRDMSCTRFRRHRVRCFMEQEVRHGEKAVYAGVQA